MMKIFIFTLILPLLTLFKVSLCDSDKEKEFSLKTEELINDYRKQRNLKPLCRHPKIVEGSSLHNREMEKIGYLTHDDHPKTNNPLGNRMNRFGVKGWNTLGENVAQGHRTPRAVVDGWIKSPGHHRNIINPAFTHHGVARANPKAYTTHMFAGMPKMPCDEGGAEGGEKSDSDSKKPSSNEDGDYEMIKYDEDGVPEFSKPETEICKLNLPNKRLMPRTWSIQPRKGDEKILN